MTSSATSSNFDVGGYASSYLGYTKLARLQFIADNVPQLRQECNKLLLQELKPGSNATLYVKVYHAVDESTRKELGCDESVAHSMMQNNQMKMDLLENELSVAKSTMLKEGIRTGHTDVGHLQYQMGNLSEALKSYMRSRDFCSMPRHVIEMCLNVITVSIDLKQFFNVANFASKVGDTLGDEVVIGKLKVASALVDLADRNFRGAALKFLEVPATLGNQFNNVVSDQDIAIYGTLCALATFERSELRTRLIENKSFVNAYLNLVPDFKTLATGFYSGSYATALPMLDAVRPRLQCDMYLASQADSLIAQIRERMVLQYFAPYSVVDLTRMAQQLQMAPAALEDALVELISAGKLSARIDASSNTLQRRERNVRAETLQKVLALSKVQGFALRRDILRLSMMQQGFVLGDAEDGGSGGAGAGRTNLSRQPSGGSVEAPDPEFSNDGMMDVTGDGYGYEYGDAYGDVGGGYAFGEEGGNEGSRAGFPSAHVMSQTSVDDAAVAHLLQAEEMYEQDDA